MFRLILLLGFSALTLTAQEKAPPLVYWFRLQDDAVTRKEAKCPVDRLEANESGNVMVRIIIDKNGRVRSAEPAQPDNRLNNAAVMAITGWEFKPQKIDGKPTEVQAMAMIDVCEEKQDVQAITLDAGLMEILALTERCKQDDESSCTEADARIKKLIIPRNVLFAQSSLDAAYGDLLLRKGDQRAAEQRYLNTLPELRNDATSSVARYTLLERLGPLYEQQHRFEDALVIYQEQEDAHQMMRKAIEQSTIRHPQKEMAQVHQAELEMLKMILQGQLRSLQALHRGAEAELVRQKLKKLQ